MATRLGFGRACPVRGGARDAEKACGRGVCFLQLDPGKAPAG